MFFVSCGSAGIEPRALNLLANKKKRKCLKYHVGHNFAFKSTVISYSALLENNDPCSKTVLSANFYSFDVSTKNAFC